MDKRRCRSWIEINRTNLKYNAQILQANMQPGCKLMAVVKANAYGHGAAMVAKCMNEIGVDSFAVATIDEGIQLRKHGITGDILVLGFTDVRRADELCYYHLTQAIIDYDYALKLNRCGQLLQVHIKIDTGMHRLGLSAEDLGQVMEVFRMSHLKVSGIYTHLCVADSLEEEAVNYTRKQVNSFYLLLQQIIEKGIRLPKVHIQSSYGLLNYPELQCDYARIGIALYGCLSVANQTKLQLKLRPVLALKSRIAMIREVAAGEGVGYGRESLMKDQSRVAVLPIGYADGLPRNLSEGRDQVLLHGQRVPILGRICMDQLLVDVTDIASVEPGDVATFIGSDDQEEMTALEVAQNAGTITNELLSRIGSRLERIYID